MERWRASRHRTRHDASDVEIVVKTLFNSDISNDADHIGEDPVDAGEAVRITGNAEVDSDNRLPTPGHRRYFNAVSEIDRIVFRIIAERRASGYDEGDLLSMLLQAQDDDGTQMSDAQLRDEVMTLFLMGMKPRLLSWSWHLLATHPEAEKSFTPSSMKCWAGEHRRFRICRT